MKILLTGFEPFGGSNVNPSEQVVKNIDDQAFSSHQFMKKIFPVDSHKAAELIREIIPEYQPNLIIHLGEASQRSAISIEKVAINWMDFRIPDNSGKKVQDQTIIPDGPTAYFSTLPVSEIINNIWSCGIPTELSLSAGAYLCNQVFYISRYYSNLLQNNCLCGFIHLPPLPEQIVHKQQPSPSMSLETSLKAIEIALATCLDHNEQNSSSD